MASAVKFARHGGSATAAFALPSALALHLPDNLGFESAERDRFEQGPCEQIWPFESVPQFV